MRIWTLFVVCALAFGCATSGQFTRAKTTGKVISPSETQTTSSGQQKLIPNKPIQVNKVPNGLTSIQQPTVESYDSNSRSFEDPPKGATILNQARHKNIAQTFSNKTAAKNDQPKSNVDIIKPVDIIEIVEGSNPGIKIYWFRLVLFYLIIGVVGWFVYYSFFEKKKEENPFSPSQASENPFSEKPSQGKDIGGGI